MSLIRDALRKAGGGKEPEILMPEPEGKKKKKKLGKPFQYLVLIGLGAGLLGAVLYFSLYGKSFFKSPLRPPVPQVSAPKIEKKTPALTESGKKETLPPVTTPKEGTKVSAPSAVTEAKGAKEKELAEKSERFFKSPSSTFIRPRPTVKLSPRPSLPPKMVSKARPPSEIPEPAENKTPKEVTEPLPIGQLFNEAVKNQQKGLYAQAIQGYQEILAERPNHWETYNNLGLIYQHQKQYTKSLSLYQKALTLNPRYLKGYNNLGLLYLTMGKLEEAVSQFNKVLELEPGFIPASINLAVAYKRQGQLELAKKVLQKALTYDAESLEALYNLGLLWEQEGVEDKAVAYYRKFISKAQGPYSDLADDLKKRWPTLN